MTWRWSHFRILILVTLAILIPTVFFPFIALDDSKHIWQNPYVMGGDWPALRQFLTHTYYGLFIPLTYLIWKLLANLSSFFQFHHPATQISAHLFHGLQVVLHLAITYLVFLLARNLFWRQQSKRTEESKLVSERAGFLLALVFALHPLQAEVVAWSSGLKDTLASVFQLLAVLTLCVQHPLRAQKGEKNVDPLWPISGRVIRLIAKPLMFWAFYLAALLSKPSSVVLPLIMLALFSLKNKSLRQIFIAALALALATAYFTKSAQPDLRLEFSIQPIERIEVVLFSIGFYLFKFLMPFNLAPDYGWSPPILLNDSFAQALMIIGFLACMAASIAAFRRRDLRPWIGLIFSGLLPVLGLISFEYQNISTVADRYMYLWPTLGLSGLIVTAFGSNLNSKYITFVYLGLGMFLAPLMAYQAFLWSGNNRLFRHTVQVNPKSYLAWNNLGLQALREDRYPEAMDGFQKALLYKADYLAALANLGVVHFKQQNWAEVIRYYEGVFKKFPALGAGSAATFGDMYFNLGAAYINVKNSVEGERAMAKATEINPDHFQAHYYLGRLLIGQNRHSEARVHFEQCRRLQPNNDEILRLLRSLRS